MKTYSEFLQYSMDKCGFTYRSLATRTDIDHPIIYRMIYNDQLPTLPQYIKILNCIVKNSNLKKGFTNQRMLNIVEKQIEEQENHKSMK